MKIGIGIGIAKSRARDTTAPTITSAASASVAGGQPLAFTVTCDDPDATFSKSGADAAQFDLDANTGELTWVGNGTQAYFAPADAGGNNVYDIALVATDLAGNASAPQSFAATVTNPLDVDLTSSLPSGVTLTRASANGTYFDVSGVMQTATTNAARFDYHPVTHAALGLLHEPAATNLFSATGDIGGTGWEKTGSLTYTADQGTDPMGGSDLNQLNFAAQFQTVRTNFALTAYASSTQYTVSLWAKVASGTRNLNVGDNGGTGDKGPYTATTTLTRYSTTYTSGGSAAASKVYPIKDSNAASFVNALAWGAQCELGASATSYIANSATTYSPVTRAKDVLIFSAAICAGVSTVRFTFDDNSTQDVAITPSAQNTFDGGTLNRMHVKHALGVA